MLGFSFNLLIAWGSEPVWTVVCGRRGRKGKGGKGKERKGKEGKGWERKGKEGKGRERMGKGGKRKGKEGKGRERKGKEWLGKEDAAWRSASLAVRTAVDGVGARVAGNGWGDEAAGDQRAWLRGRLRTANGCGELRGRLRTASVQGRLEMGGEKTPLEISELGCANGCGGEMGGENCADGCGRRGCKGVAGNGWGEEAAGDERAWLRGRLRTGNGCGELRGRLRMAWVQRSGWKWVGSLRSRWWWASSAVRTAADGKWVRRTARTAADGVGATEWLEMGGEQKPLVMSELGCADGCGRAMGAEKCVDGCGWRECNGVAGNGWGEEAAGDERAWLRGRLRTANGCGELRMAQVKRSGWKSVGRRSRWWWASLAARTAADGKWVRRTARLAADGVGAREWLEMGGEKKPLVMSELGCADGCGRQMGVENCADRCGGRGCKGSGWKWVGRRSRWWWASSAARMAADTKWVRRTARTAAHAVGVREKWVGRRSRWWWASSAARTAADGKWVRRTARKAADGVGATEWLEMGGEKKPLVMSELGCADGCGRAMMGAKKCADGCGWRGCNGVAGNGWGEEAAGDVRAWLRGRLRTGKWVRRTARKAADGVGATEWLEMGGEKKPLVMSELGCADGCGRAMMGAKKCADGCGWRGCNGVAGNGWGEEAAGDVRAWLRGRLRTGNGCGEARGRLRTAWVQGSVGNGWGEEAAGDERAWLRGRLRTGNGCGELRGRLRMAWVQRSGWKWVGSLRSRWWWASSAVRTAADGKWVRRTARTAADGVGATEWLEMGGEQKPLVMSELGCADGCGRAMGAEKCVDGCGWRECNGVAGNGWGEEAAGDERAWLRGRLRTANGCGELRMAQVKRSGWKSVGRRSRWWWASLAARTAADGKWVRRTARLAADGVGAREWLEMGGEKKPLVMSELGCADGCGRQMGVENCADRCGGRGCKGSGWKWVGRRSRWWWASSAARMAADTKWVRRTARTAAHAVGVREKWVGRRSRWWWASSAARTAADGKFESRQAKRQQTNLSNIDNLFIPKSIFDAWVLV